MTPWRVPLPTIALLVVVGCRSSALGGSAGIESPCDPLAPKPITLGAIVGVGQDAGGTLYVDSANGIFVSQAGQLTRQHVTGTGQSGSSQFIFTLEATATGDAGSAMDLLVETQGTRAIAMALGPAGARSFLGQSDAGITSLTLVPPTA